MSYLSDMYDLSIDENVNLVRQNILTPMLVERDYAAAVGVVEEILLAQPDRIRERIELASFCIRLGEPDRAAEQIQIAVTQSPEDPILAAQAIQILLQAKRNIDAATVAVTFLPDFMNDAQLANLAMMAYYRSGLTAKSIDAARVTAQLNKDNIGIVSRAAGVLTAAGHASEAVQALIEAEIDLCEDPDAFFEMGRAKFSLNKRDDEALNYLQVAAQLDPENARTADLLLRALLANGKSRQAVDVVEESGGALAKSRSFRLQYARALRSVRRYDEAADIMVELADADPGNSVLQRQCASALALAGRQEQALQVYQGDLGVRETGLSDRFMDDLDGIPLRLDDANIPAARFDWAYQCMQDLGVAPENRAEWEDKVRWQNLADYLILDWLECRYEQADQILDLIDNIDEAAACVNDGREAGQGMFVVTGHIGALFAGPAALIASGLDPIWVASTPVLENGPAAGRILSTSSSDEISLARSIMGSILEGKTVTIAIDGAGVPNLPRRTLFNRKIGLSDFVPRTCYRKGTKSFFTVLLWKGGRIRVEMVPLPAPVSGEDQDAFVDRWLDAYIAEVTKIFVEHPDNLRMSGGFWSGIST